MNKIENQKPDKADIKTGLSEKLYALMRKKDCNQAEIINETGITQSKMSDILNPNKKTLPTLAELIALAKYFEVSVDELLGREITGKTDNTTYGIAQILADWLLDGRISIENVTITECAPPETPPDYDGPDWEPYDYINQEFTYPAVIFPVYRNSNFFDDGYKNSYLNECFISDLKKLEKARSAISQDDLQDLLEKRLQLLKDNLDKYNSHLK